MIIERILSGLAGDAPIRAMLVGAHWTAVCSRRCGLASTVLGDKPHSHASVRDAGRLHLHHMSARQLAEYARSDCPLEAGIGLAAVKSLIEPDMSRAVEVNAAQVLAERGGQNGGPGLDGLLALGRPGSLVMVLGPTTPLSPVLFDHGVPLLSGTLVVDEAAALGAIGQGATFQQVAGARLLTLSRESGPARPAGEAAP